MLIVIERNQIYTKCVIFKFSVLHLVCGMGFFSKIQKNEHKIYKLTLNYKKSISI